MRYFHMIVMNSKEKLLDFISVSENDKDLQEFFHDSVTNNTGFGVLSNENDLVYIPEEFFKSCSFIIKEVDEKGNAL